MGVVRSVVKILLYLLFLGETLHHMIVVAWKEKKDVSGPIPVYCTNRIKPLFSKTSWF